MLKIATWRNMPPIRILTSRQRPAFRFGKAGGADEWIRDRSQVTAGIRNFCAGAALSEQSRLHV